MSQIFELSVSDLSQGLKSKEFSSVEVTSAFLKRMDNFSRVNAFITSCPETAMAQAQEADKRIAAGDSNPLLGVPLAIKDVLTTKGIKTTCGSNILKDFIPPYTATSVSKLEQLGSVNLGKTNMDEFAMGSSNETSAFGPVQNPWDLERVPGGSSGGSAAAVAARLAPASLGTDTGGSVRQPASLCNLVGLKPTYGRVSRYGLIAYASSLDSVGVFSSTAKDAAVILQAISGKDPLDATSVDQAVPDFSASLDQDIKGLRIGIPNEYFIPGMNPDVEKLVREAISKLEEMGAKIVPISLPSTNLSVATYYVIAPAEASSNLARFDGIRYGNRSKDAKDLIEVYKKTRAEGFGEEVQRRIMVGAYVLSSGYYDAYYLRAQKIRTLIANEFKKAFSEQCDLIACPTSPCTAFKIGEKTDDPLAMYLSDIFTIPVNMAGIPGLSIPCGFDSSKLPVGLQLIGKAWDEATLLRVAHNYQKVSDWHTQIPTNFR
jgi:aspartyl-tRNA(Asn)/glutamyl-tRNA(Gln) amidotransferase subunit A